MKAQHTPVDEYIRRSTPAQQIIWNELLITLGENISVFPFFFHGLYVGDFSAYVANKLFFGYEVTHYLAVSGGVNLVNAPTNQYYDRFNNVIGNVVDDIPYWDVVAAAPKYKYQHCHEKNIVFSHIITDYTYIKFIGYRLTTL
jgi:hypothetical protein